MQSRKPAATKSSPDATEALTEFCCFQKTVRKAVVVSYSRLILNMCF